MTVGAVRRGAGRQARRIRSAAARQKAIFTPFRLVMLAIAIVVSATGYWVWQSRTRDRAELELRSAVEEGRSALQAGDLEKAAEQFALANAALKILGRDDAASREVRQLARETTAANALAVSTLPNIAQEALRRQDDANDNWDDVFQTLYGDSWIVMETTIEQASTPDDTQHLVLNYPLVVDGVPFAIDVDLPIFRRLPLDDEPRRVIFAGQLASCRPVSPAARQWKFELRAETAFLWSGFDTLRALGLTSGDARSEQVLRQVLVEQSRLMGIGSRE